MNEFADRLDSMAGRATTGVSISDPSITSGPVRQPQRRREIAFGLVAAMAIATMLFLWQSSDSSTTSVAAGEGADALAAAAQGETPCAVEPLLNVLRSGLPTLDYEPVGSYEALASSTPLAVSGTILKAERVDTNGSSFIELQVDDVVELTTGVAQPDVMVIAYVAVWAEGSAPDPLADFELSSDTRFVGFVQPWSGLRGGWNPGIEGLYVSCGDAGPLHAVIIDAASSSDPVEPTRTELKTHLTNLQPVDPTDPSQIPSTPTQADPATPQEQEELQQVMIEAAAAWWDSTGPDDYRLRYFEWKSEGRATAATLSVVDGEVVATEFSDGLGPPERIWTVDEMFVAIAEADIVREIQFDPVTSAPTLLSLDPDRTVPGDEFAFRDIQLVSQSDLDAVDDVLAEWLPEPIAVPDALWNMEPMTIVDPDEIEQVYVLHQVPGLDVYFYVEDDQVCVVAARVRQLDPREYNGASSTCRWKTDFLASPIRLGEVVVDDGDPFLLVVPQLDVGDAEWSVEGAGGELHVTEWSALLTVEGRAAPGRERIQFTCECGDRLYILSN